MKKLLTLIALLMATTNIYAFTQNGLRYTISPTNAKIVGVEDERSTYSSVTIPNIVTYNGEEYCVISIENEAFKECINLSSVTFNKESNLETIGESAFEDCQLLSEINIPKSVTSIGYNAFNRCISLSSVTFEQESKLSTIVSFAFCQCQSLSNIDIPKSVTFIGNSAFLECSALSSVTFEGNACQNAISYDAFDGVGTLESPATLTLPDDWDNENLPIDNKTPWYGGYFNSNRYQIPIDQLKSDAKNDIDEAMGEYKSNLYLLSIIANELNAIDNATSKATIDTNKEAAIAKITPAVTAFQEVKASALGTMSTEQDGPAVKVKKGDDTIILYGPDKVEFIKAETEK